MPNNDGRLSDLHLGKFNDVELFNETTLHKPGELGRRGDFQGKTYQLVQLDSGATASTSVGISAAGQLAFWKDKSAYLVTNDIAQAIGAEDATLDNKRNNVAGVIRTAVTAGDHCFIQQGGRCSTATDGGGDFTIGDSVIAANGTSAQGDRVAAGTAVTHTLVGLVAGAEASNLTAVDLELPGIP
jgi:hypothetical protein